MNEIVIGYGKHVGYRISELPESELDALADRFPLSLDKLAGDPSREVLLVVIAVHEERARRKAGGTAEMHMCSTRDLAEQIVRQGFRDLSKVHHPDRKGDSQTQQRLTGARDRLLKFAKDIPDDFDRRNVIIVEAASISPPEQDSFGGISADDVPF